MPRKDGTPTAAERKEAQRVIANAQFIARRTDAELATMETDYLLDDSCRAQIAAEVRRRKGANS